MKGKALFLAHTLHVQRASLSTGISPSQNSHVDSKVLVKSPPAPETVSFRDTLRKRLEHPRLLRQGRGLGEATQIDLGDQRTNEEQGRSGWKGDDGSDDWKENQIICTPAKHRSPHASHQPQTVSDLCTPHVTRSRLARFHLVASLFPVNRTPASKTPTSRPQNIAKGSSIISTKTLLAYYPVLLSMRPSWTRTTAVGRGPGFRAPPCAGEGPTEGVHRQAFVTEKENATPVETGSLFDARWSPIRGEKLRAVWARHRSLLPYLSPVRKLCLVSDPKPTPHPRHGLAVAVKSTEPPTKVPRRWKLGGTENLIEQAEAGEKVGKLWALGRPIEGRKERSGIDLKRFAEGFEEQSIGTGGFPPCAPRRGRYDFKTFSIPLILFPIFIRLAGPGSAIIRRSPATTLESKQPSTSRGLKRQEALPDKDEIVEKLIDPLINPRKRLTVLRVGGKETSAARNPADNAGRRKTILSSILLQAARTASRPASVSSLLGARLFLFHPSALEPIEGVLPAASTFGSRLASLRILVTVDVSNWPAPTP
ncbi:hypothetical protein BDK51DRAFT_46293 [Blyttiomyces helicus]|uniref:Uncharacterized protein n=1 Tax=Blyttiomyces helicus TaxID=388810 RepID=A0A4P9WI11_9FUNG|nr:hypothetical protein BDK51DRAFT_46293 [Blyttiomyces helicus]|eukprot:RKO91078.1 hypothetical protein BDK51DRAFT_46293 [Blyttiomyces helicus]